MLWCLRLESWRRPLWGVLMQKPNKHSLITHDQLMMGTGSREFNSRIGHDHSDRSLCPCVCLSPRLHKHLSLTCRSPPTHAPPWAAQSDYVGNEGCIALIIRVYWAAATGSCRESPFRFKPRCWQGSTPLKYPWARHEILASSGWSWDK